VASGEWRHAPWFAAVVAVGGLAAELLAVGADVRAGAARRVGPGGLTLASRCDSGARGVEPRDVGVGSALAVARTRQSVTTEVDWNPDAIEVHRIDQRAVGPGAEWQGRYKGMGSMGIKLDEYERPQRLVFSITGNRIDMHWAFGFVPDGAGTQLTAVAELQPKGVMRLMTPFFGPMMRRTFSRRPAQLAAGIAARRSQQPQA
jgi:hypothetical protein